MAKNSQNDTNATRRFQNATFVFYLQHAVLLCNTQNQFATQTEKCNTREKVATNQTIGLVAKFLLDKRKKFFTLIPRTTFSKIA